MTLGNQSSSKLQMGSSRNRDPLKLSRDEDPSWDLEDPPKPRRKPSRTYSVLFIVKTFINHHLIVHPSWGVLESLIAPPLFVTIWSGAFTMIINCYERLHINTVVLSFVTT